MNAKRAGILFLAMILFERAIVRVLIITQMQVGVITGSILSELIMIVPVLVVYAISRGSFSEVFGIRKVRLSTLLLSVVFTVTLLPMVACCNAFSMYFTKNETVEILESFSSLPFALLFLFAAVVAPICEEWTFRGILYSGFRKSGSALQAIVITGVLFGLFHQNLNQMIYAMVLGFFLAALREVTGSILPTIVCHMTVNGISTVSSFLEESKPEESSGTAQSLANMQDMISPEMISNALILLIPMAAVMGMLAFGLLIRIAKTQQALPRLKNILEGREQEKGKVLGIPLIVGMVICTIFVFLDMQR